MPTVWFSLKKSLHCKSEPQDVHDPKSKKHLATILTRKPGRSGCSRSIANLKDVIHGGSKRHSEKPVNCSPRSIGSSEFLNPITHEVILSDTRCELKITGFNGGLNNGGLEGGTLMPGTPGPGGHLTMNNVKNQQQHTTARRTVSNSLLLSSDGKNGVQKPRETESNGSNGGGGAVTCHKCGKQFGKWENLEAHHLWKHAVTELMEGDSSRKIVEIICRSGWLKPDNNSGRIEKVLKVHNMQKTLARFEEYRDLVKTKASKLPKKHPRCLADGNELLRFYGTTIACSLGINGESSLCISDKCSVCRIIRHGFSTNRELKDGVGVFTTSTSARAFESIEVSEDGPDARRALMVCRVIAGRVHRPLENIQEITGQTGFDSLAGKVGPHSNIEDLYLLSPKALLPCFVVICKL
ncbi:putative transcription factor C2H2 family [Helianthus annuus]|nr:putative transcription factor C2H2 family [Helianthus annuus]KAJ0601395.1 putative transcription factor C2H2 family [Helianthus annuus]KAJ0608513.1 putative transcription factor C2H2 family [Helianthus annuus]KAJ0768578.1 putative transcription factor C2H2 family [Helianthus annuus]KAJ0774323.1 putative transcription factor C2H2 family [Helianthus annuus]